MTSKANEFYEEFHAAQGNATADEIVAVTKLREYAKWLEESLRIERSDHHNAVITTERAMQKWRESQARVVELEQVADHHKAECESARKIALGKLVGPAGDEATWRRRLGWDTEDGTQNCPPHARFVEQQKAAKPGGRGE